MGELFGTDGVRGVAGRDLDARLATSLAAAAAHVLGGSRASDSARPSAVVGRDPRASGEFLEAAVVAGLAESGVDVLRLGVIPTPGVAYLTDVLDADFGVMLSASHNAAADGAGQGLPPAGFGRVSVAAGEAERYLEHLLQTVAGSAGGQAKPLAGWRVVVDCAHGAAYALAPRLLAEAGAEVVAIGVEPDGININEGCGSTSLGALQSAVTQIGADAGIAYDGDADRCLAVDAAGEVIDGDQIL